MQRSLLVTSRAYFLVAFALFQQVCSIAILAFSSPRQTCVRDVLYTRRHTNRSAMFVCARCGSVLHSLPDRNAVLVHCGIVSYREQGNVLPNVVEDYEKIAGHEFGTRGIAIHVQHIECIAQIWWGAVAWRRLPHQHGIVGLDRTGGANVQKFTIGHTDEFSSREFHRQQRRSPITTSHCFQFILQALKCRRIIVTYEVILAIQRLINLSGKDLSEPSWDVLCEILIAISDNIAYYGKEESPTPPIIDT